MLDVQEAADARGSDLGEGSGDVRAPVLMQATDAAKEKSAIEQALMAESTVCATNERKPVGSPRRRSAAQRNAPWPMSDFVWWPPLSRRGPL
jgi:hypothetical protein